MLDLLLPRAWNWRNSGFPTTRSLYDFFFLFFLAVGLLLLAYVVRCTWWLTSCLNLNLQTIPSDLAKNVKILNLDLGNNLIERSSDLKVCSLFCYLIYHGNLECHNYLFGCQVLSELRYLRNLNLQGNPISEKDSLVKKVIFPDKLIFQVL